MLALDKLLGVILIFLGLTILMWAYDSPQYKVIELAAILVSGIAVLCAGTIAWLWNEPYEES